MCIFVRFRAPKIYKEKILLYFVIILEKKTLLKISFTSRFYFLLHNYISHK